MQFPGMSPEEMNAEWMDRKRNYVENCLRGSRNWAYARMHLSKRILTIYHRTDRRYVDVLQVNLPLMIGMIPDLLKPAIRAVRFENIGGDTWRTYVDLDAEKL